MQFEDFGPISHSHTRMGNADRQCHQNFIHPLPRPWCSTGFPVSLDMPGSKVRRHFETMRNVCLIPGFLTLSLYRGSMICVLGKHTGVFSCPRTQAAGRLCHLVNHNRMARDAGHTSKNSSGVNALSPLHSLSLFTVQLGTLRKVQVLQGYIMSVH